ncbi:MAG: taurine transport system permease protein [Gammaproteobacteria bacterium]|jgi:taurine transport system permease protein
MIVGTLFIVCIVLLLWSIFYGQKIIRNEKMDALFGNPVKALGGWHWVIAGVSTIFIVWFYFSWDAARSYFPEAGNELCQVAKLNRTANPIRSSFPLDDRLLDGTKLLERDYAQIDSMAEQLENIEFNEADRSELQAIIAGMRAALAAQADPDLIDSAIAARFSDVASQIDGLAQKMSDAEYPANYAQADIDEAMAQPAWGETYVEIPPLPRTDRGRKFEAASLEMAEISKEYRTIKNNGVKIIAILDALESRFNQFEIDQTGDASTVVEREELLRQINKIFKRIDNGRIFPPAMTETVEKSLITLDKVQREQQGSLIYINALAMPGGDILAGNSACSEQGSGRWLPKPSDTLRTFVRMADPEVGYKGIPLLWYKMKPVAEMIAFVVPDWIADLIPGEYPRHDNAGKVLSNFKGSVYSLATGDYESFGIPVPTGHIWDSIMRVLAGLFFGIILGVPLGLFMGLSRFAKGFFDPLIELYRPIPPLAWAPLILTIFGIQDDGKIFLLFMVAFAIMVISARTGATGTQLSKIHAAHSLGASKRQIIRQVILPNSLPEILTGIRIAIGVCWGTLVAAEMLAGTTGIGFVENVARKQSDYEIIWMTILLLGMLGLLFDLIMRYVIKRSIPWRGKG